MFLKPKLASLNAIMIIENILKKCLQAVKEGV